MLMFEFIRKWRRQRVADRVVASGKRIRELRAVRAGIDSTIWPHDAAIIDAEIEQRERRHTALLDYLKKTA